MNKKLIQTAQEWINAHVEYCVYDNCDAMHELDKLESRFYALSGDKIKVENFVKKNMEKDYKLAAENIAKRDGVYPDDLENTPSDLLFNPILE